MEDWRKEALRNARLRSAEAVVRGDENILLSQKDNLTMLKLFTDESLVGQKGTLTYDNNINSSSGNTGTEPSRQQSAHKSSRQRSGNRARSGNKKKQSSTRQRTDPSLMSTESLVNPFLPVPDDDPPEIMSASQLPQLADQFPPYALRLDPEEIHRMIFALAGV